MEKIFKILFLFCLFIAVMIVTNKITGRPIYPGKDEKPISNVKIKPAFFLLLKIHLKRRAIMKQAEKIQKFKTVHVENGVFLYPDGSEVSLFGVNYLPMSWYQYKNMKKLNADFRKAIKKDVADMKKCGVQIVRVHFFESENCDTNGNLIKNDHLKIFDTLVDELNRQGIYLFLTPLAWWYSPCELHDAYSRRISKMRMMYGEHALTSSENFINHLLTHTNTLTGNQLKDEPCLCAFEIINEPWYWPYESVANPNFDVEWRSDQTSAEVLKKDLELWKQMWENFCKEKHLDSSKDSYVKFQYKIMSNFLKRMIGSIRGTGAKQPIASSLFDAIDKKGVLKAIGESKVDAVTDGWYPGGFTTLHENVNQMPDETRVYQLPDEVRDKARMIYEFDICCTYNNVGMYPAMARKWRSVGAQIACQFQYDSAITAPYNSDWGCHYFNYEITPAKAVAFNIASETFAAVPRYIKYPTPSDNEIFYGTAISFKNQQVLRVAENKVYYAHSLKNWIPFKLPTFPNFIMGRGDSPYIEYSGTGLYKLEQISPAKLKLSITKNTIINGKIDLDFFLKSSLGKSKVILDNSTEKFKLKLQGWNNFKCFDQNAGKIKIVQNAFEVKPGNTYFLTK